MFDARLRPLVDRILDPVGAFVARQGVTANQISFAGFGLGIGAAIAVALGFEIAAVMLIIANRICDGLDGAVARSTGSTDLGAYLDTVSYTHLTLPTKA